jgi:hypothetical protein
VPLVFHNELRNSGGIDINGRDLRHHPACRGTVRDSVVWHASLYDNSCEGTSGSRAVPTPASAPAPGSGTRQHRRNFRPQPAARAACLRRRCRKCTAAARETTF